MKTGRKMKVYSDEEKATILSLRDAGMCYTEIARVIHSSHPMVKAFLDSQGYPKMIKARKPLAPEVENEIVQLYQEGSSIKDIHELLHLSTPTIRICLRKHEVPIRDRYTYHPRKEKLYDMKRLRDFA